MLPGPQSRHSPGTGASDLVQTVAIDHTGPTLADANDYELLETQKSDAALKTIIGITMIVTLVIQQ